MTKLISVFICMVAVTLGTSWAHAANILPIKLQGVVQNQATTDAFTTNFTTNDHASCTNPPETCIPDADAAEYLTITGQTFNFTHPDWPGSF